MRRLAPLLLASLLTVTLVAVPEAAADTVGWAPCDQNARAECGSVGVPVDWSRPDGERFELAVARRQAPDRSAVVGTLVYLPAGPGSSGVDAVANDQIFDLLFPAPLAERFDIVSFDPRGVRRSHPVLCDPALVAELVGRPTPTDQREFDELLDAQAAVGADCRARTGELFDHLDSTNAARDVDAFRAALGVSELNLYGLSYGTVIGQMYAERFPDRIRTMILDAVYDHSVGSDRFALTGALAAQESFDQFVLWCEGTPECAVHGRNVRGLVADLFDRAERGRLTDPDDGTAIDPSALTSRLVTPLSQPNLVGVGQEIARLADGTATRQAAAQELVPLPIYTQCADSVNDTDSFAHAERLRALSRIVAPDVRRGAYDVSMLCVNPPTPATNPQRPLHAPGVPPVMVLNSRYDPSTPYQGARRVAEQLDGSVLVTYDGLGHGAATRTDCTRDLVYRYLTEHELPASGTHCPAAQ